MPDQKASLSITELPELDIPELGQIPEQAIPPELEAIDLETLNVIAARKGVEVHKKRASYGVVSATTDVKGKTRLTAHIPNELRKDVQMATTLTTSAFLRSLRKRFGFGWTPRDCGGLAVSCYTSGRRQQGLSRPVFDETTVLSGMLGPVHTGGNGQLLTELAMGPGTTPECVVLPFPPNSENRCKRSWRQLHGCPTPRPQQSI